MNEGAGQRRLTSEIKTILSLCSVYHFGFVSKSEGLHLAAWNVSFTHDWKFPLHLGRLNTRHSRWRSLGTARHSFLIWINYPISPCVKHCFSFSQLLQLFVRAVPCAHLFTIHVRACQHDWVLAFSTVWGSFEIQILPHRNASIILTFHILSRRGSAGFIFRTWFCFFYSVQALAVILHCLQWKSPNNTITLFLVCFVKQFTQAVKYSKYTVVKWEPKEIMSAHRAPIPWICSSQPQDGRMYQLRLCRFTVTCTQHHNKCTPEACWIWKIHEILYKYTFSLNILSIIFFKTLDSTRGIICLTWFNSSLIHCLPRKFRFEASICGKSRELHTMQ